MTRIRVFTLTAGLVTALSFAPATAAAQDCTWVKTTLPLPAGHTRGDVSGAANGGWFVGSGETTSAVRWHGGQVEDLGQAFGKPTELSDINSSGVAVGLNYSEGFTESAVVYRNGQFQYLPKPLGTRSVRAKAINDAGDIAGITVGDGDNFDTTLWRAGSPGTVQVINPDPAVYGYVSPVDIDEQGRILLRAESSDGPAHFVRYPDGTMTRLPLTGVSNLDAFRDGRISGEYAVNRRYMTGEWDLAGQLVRTFDIRAWLSVVDSGTLTSGTYRTADKGYALGVWDNGVFVHTLITGPTDDFSRPMITDDGVIATSDQSSGAAVTFRHTC